MEEGDLEEGFEGGFMELLEGEEEKGYFLSSPSPSSSSSSMSTTQMLRFGLNRVPQKSSDSSLSTLSSSPSSTTTITSSKTSMEVESSRGGGGGGGRTTAAAASTGTCKKPKKEGSASLGTIKVRKEKLGERITALQQLVSPFGKSDTASVLHEALGYIRFLHDQVQVLSSPYLQRLPSSAHLQEGRGEASRRSDLRSRGLCLVPVSCTEHVANSNGADFWSPAMRSDNSSPKH